MPSPPSLGMGHKAIIVEATGAKVHVLSTQEGSYCKVHTHTHTQRDDNKLPSKGP